MLLWLIGITSYLLVFAQSYQLNMTEYFKMPNLYDFDDYDHCLREFNELSTYCFVRAEVLPQNNSEAWQAIADISKYTKHHFDHKHLYFGVCVRWCEDELAELDENATKELFGGILSNNNKVNTYLKLFSAEDGNRQRSNRLLNQCINMKLGELYGLKAESVVEYCDSNHKVVEEDYWNLTFYCTLCVLILLVTLSSFYDLYLKHKRNDKVLADCDHYKAPINGKANKFAVIFSMSRNWYRLTQKPTGKIGRDLCFLDCFKFFSMFMVIFAHTNWVFYEGAISNPQDPENLLHTAAGTLLISGSLITVTFFVISGLLLTVNWLAVMKVKSDLTAAEYVEAFVKFNIFRYIRLTLPYGFVLLMSGVYFDIPGGPLWRHIIEREQLSCRKNWWANLLYINNMVNNNERCLLQSWYLAADTHCFILCLVMLMVANKWPKIRFYVMGVIGAIFYVTPGIVTYVKKFSPIFIPSPQTQKDSFIDDLQFSEFYAPFYMNFACYFCGIIAALLYDHLSTKQFQLHKYKTFQIIWYSMLPLGVLWIFSSHPMLQHYSQEQSLVWNSIYAMIHRNTWAFGLGIVVLGMTCKVGWIIRKFACLPIFQILGRLTYGAFIVHLLVARIVLGTMRDPIYFGTGIMFTFVIFNTTASYLFSLVLAILLELPVSAFLKLLR